MAKMIEVTKAGGAYPDHEDDLKIRINADNINICQPVMEDDVGQSTIIFNNETRINVVETLERLSSLINK